MNSKFKVGDKVKILPSASNIGVNDAGIGKIGTVTDCSYMMQYIKVYMDERCKITGHRRDWAVSPKDIEPVIKVGQQLLFSFMG
ncbi:hypothetical protein LCGC14_0404220 [marine sediment metagenome]|uniref:Uncharacterized protein n=1 Tax=marine sediment metagenome TaxID=412755 RepID=A0A0F9W4Y8_9ZZZZ